MKQLNSKYHIIFITILFFTTSISAQKSENFWTKTSKVNLSNTQKVIKKTEPIKASFYKLDINGLKNILLNAPKRNGFIGTSKVIVDFPNADGSLEAYRVLEASVLHPTLQEQYPNIRSYIGQSIDNPSKIIRFSITELGLHSMALGAKNGTQFIDPYSTNDNYIVYFKNDLSSYSNLFECNVVDELSAKKPSLNSSTRNANDGMMRTFDLALGSSVEYSVFHGDDVNSVLTAMGVTMTRVNGVYERELSITMQLVPNNNLLVSTTGNSIFGNTSSVINTSTTIIDGIIGSANYDIGHVFTTGSGGVAGLGVICNNGNKGRGTTGLSAPVGDVFDIDFVAHEMGHQFGGNHTFNGSTLNCAGGNRNASTAYEPGSGSTIMAYAGICAPQNVQNNSDDYFHQASLNEIWTYISGTSCADLLVTGNTAPTADAGQSYTIPISTTYKLTGSSTDTDGTGSHTFTWEEYDLGPAGLPLETNVSGPLVRTFIGTTNPVRYIPSLCDVINNGGISTTWEKLASVGRDMNFQLTVRDNSLAGGQTDSDNMTVTVENVTPFTMSAPNTSLTWNVGTEQTVTWNVGQTTNATINCQNVNILLLTDGCLTSPIMIACNTPNDGTEPIIVPNNVGSNNRIMVEAADNIFYDISDVDFSIANPSPTYVLQKNNLCATSTVCTNGNINIDFDFSVIAGFNESTTFSASNLPTGVIANFTPNSLNIDGVTTLNLSNFSAVAAGDYSILVNGISTSVSQAISANITVFDAAINSTTLVSPVNGITDLIPPDVTLSWNLDSNAQDYLIEIATDNGFSNIVDSATIQTSSFTTNLLISNTQYYWRVTASNQCSSASASSVFNFTTANVSCDFFTAVDTPITISSAAPPNQSYTSIITVTPDLPILDVNVTLNIRHTWDEDLDITLTSPTGTIIELTSTNGADGDNYTNTVFDQEGTNPITGGSAPFTGTFVPEGDLSLIYGETSGGDWILTVTDTANGDGGSLDGFSLELCVQGTLSINENSFDGFTIFPNPNNGEFTVRLNSNSSENIKISIYDIRGRRVFDNLYRNNVSNFNKIIHLYNIQSGLYLINVSDGFKTQTKKIIIR